MATTRKANGKKRVIKLKIDPNKQGSQQVVKPSMGNGTGGLVVKSTLKKTNG